MIYNIVGRRKRGKTTLGLYMARKDSETRAIFDPRGMIPGCDRSMRVTSAVDLIEQAMPRLADGELREVVYVPADDDLTRPFALFAGELSRWIAERPTQPINVLIDELGFLDSARRDPPVFRRVLRSCEPDIFHVFMTCHRPIDVPVNTRAIADYWALFHCVQEHDIEIVRERCGERIAKQVQRLTTRSFVLFDDAEPDKSREFPDRPDAHGHNPWFIELRSARDRAVEIDRLSGIDHKGIDGLPLLD